MGGLAILLNISGWNIAHDVALVYQSMFIYNAVTELSNVQRNFTIQPTKKPHQSDSPNEPIYLRCK